MSTEKHNPLPDVQEDLEARPSRGIQSVEVGGQLLRALARSGRQMALKDLAREADMTPAKAHPYLVSFGKLGLIEQDPVALRLGCTVSAAVWGPQGPVIIRVEQGPTPVHVAMRHGIPASLRHTGTGKVFAAYRPHEEIVQGLAREGHPGALDDAAFKRELDTIRRTGLARVQEEFMPGLCAMAVPVFDGFGQLALAIATIGPSRLLDLDPNGSQAKALQQVAQELSSRLGAVT